MPYSYQQQGARRKIKTCKGMVFRKMYTLKISVIESPVVKERLQKAAAIHHMEKKLTNKTKQRYDWQNISLIFYEHQALEKSWLERVYKMHNTERDLRYKKPLKQKILLCFSAPTLKRGKCHNQRRIYTLKCSITGCQKWWG